MTGESVSNTNPPSAAMLAWAVAQVGLCLLVASPVRRLLERRRVWRAVRPVGGASMTLYLWHMLPVLVAAAAFYLTALAPEPGYGSGAWWALRAPWLLLLAAILAGVVAALRPLERGLALAYERCRPQAEVRHPALLGLGLAASVLALTRWATEGFAHDGRFPLQPALGFMVGAALILSSGARAGAENRVSGGRPTEA